MIAGTLQSDNGGAVVQWKWFAVEKSLLTWRRDFKLQDPIIPFDGALPMS